MSSLYHILGISRQDMLSRMEDLKNVSNNMANMTTTGYKKTRLNFQELLQDQMKGGTQVTSTQALTQQGILKQTDNALDLAIDGSGYFAVTLPDGRTGYTRDGEIRMDENNQLVTASGHKLVWQGTLPATFDEMKIETNGVVMTRTGDTWTTAGNIPLYNVPNESALSGYGNNVWLTNESSGDATAGTSGAENYGTIRVRMLEQSNVDLAEEMTDMMTLQRIFSLSTKAFQQTDSMIGTAVNMRRA